MVAKPFSLSVRAVVFDSQNRCLLIRRSAHNHHFAGCWEWPGGKVDAGEDFAHAVRREMDEETKLAVEIVGLAGATQFEMSHAHVVVLCMEARVTGGEFGLSAEHDDSAWVALNELKRYNLLPVVGEFMLEYATRKAQSITPP